MAKKNNNKTNTPDKKPTKISQSFSKKPPKGKETVNEDKKSK